MQFISISVESTCHYSLVTFTFGMMHMHIFVCPAIVESAILAVAVCKLPYIVNHLPTMSSPHKTHAMR
jgi:hypothetical protein